ncbi:MraY family glycosyltransferase, partial [Acinetobacter baumannii]
VIWILAVTNAHNMMDGLDGLATGISSVEATALSFSLLLCGNVPYARVGLILVGCCIGYLPFNRHPARVFLGDTGSLFLG